MDTVLFNLAFGFYAIALFHSGVAFFFKRSIFFRVALAAVLIGFLFHTGFLLLAGIEHSFYLLTGLRESLAFLAWTVSLCFLITYLRYRVEALGLFLLPLVAVLMLGTVFLEATPLPGVLESWWVYIHAACMVLAHGLLFVALAVGFAYLLEERELKNKKPRRFYHHLPPLEVLDRLFQISLLTGFGFMTLGLLSGILWAGRNPGTSWLQDPSSVVSLVTWGIYLLLVYMRLSAGWRGGRAVWVSALGFLLIAFTYAGATLLGGLHQF